MSADDADDEERFTFEEYIDMIRERSNESLIDDIDKTSTLSNWAAVTNGTCNSTCTSACNSSCNSAGTSTCNSTTNSTGSSKEGRASSTSPNLLEGEESQDPVEKRILFKQQMSEEIHESELDSKEKLEVNDKIEPQLPPAHVTHCKKRKKGNRKIRKKSLETLTLLGNSVCYNMLSVVVAMVTSLSTICLIFL